MHYFCACLIIFLCCFKFEHLTEHKQFAQTQLHHRSFLKRISVLTCAPAQAVWIAKVEQAPEKLWSNPDGSVQLENVEVSFYETRTDRSKGASRQAIFGRMVRTERPESSKTKKIYWLDKLTLSSEHILRVFDPSTYLVKVNARTAVTKLMEEHVKEITQFYASKNRYIKWLKEVEKGKKSVN